MKYKPVELSEVNTYSIHDRIHKSATPPNKLPDRGTSYSEFIDSLPDYLGAKSLKILVQEIVLAHQSNMPVVAALGGHVIKVGCGPIIIDLIERGIINAIACGMVAETFSFFREVIDHSKTVGSLGKSIGELIEKTSPHSTSVIKTAVKHDIPCCVHVALGTDTIHMADINTPQLSDASMYDFRLLCDVVSKLGVWMNIGSAVIMPEVFLKAITVARNLGAKLDNLFTANLDMIQHYRPHHNVVTRPVKPGRGVELTGHHEIMLPLLRQAIIEKLT